MKWRQDAPSLLAKGLCMNESGEMGVGTYTEYGWVFPFYFGKVVAWTELPTFQVEENVESRNKNECI